MTLSFYNYLWLLLILIPITLVFSRSLTDRPPLLKYGSFILRALAIIFLVLALCRPFANFSTRDRHTVFLIDVSESITPEESQKAEKTVQSLKGKLPASDTMSVFKFASGIQPPDKDTPDGVGDEKFRRSTRIAEALNSAAFAFPAGKTKRIVLFSDGVDTGGGIEKALKNLKNRGVEVIFAPVKPFGHPEAAVIEVRPSTGKAWQGERVRLSAAITANQEMKGVLHFINRGVTVRSLPVKMTAEKRTVVESDFTITAEHGDIWSVELAPDQDYFAINNRASCKVETGGRMKVLALHDKPRELRQFTSAMAKQGIDVEARGRHGMPDKPEKLLEFRAVILAGIPADALNRNQMSLLRSYVTDYGRGLIMTGSTQSFGLGGWYKTPVESVLPLTSRYEKDREQPSMSMVLIIDKSGSMGGDKIEMARRAAKSAVELLGPRDRIGVVAFDGTPFKVCPMTPGAAGSEASSAIEKIAAGGGTNLYPAMIMARDMLRTEASRIKHVIILSDGQSIPGDFAGVTDELTAGGCTVSTVALGQGAHAALMRQIAEKGGGRYYFSNDPANIPKIFARETIEASKSAIKEEPFAVVSAVRDGFMSGLDPGKAPFLLGYVMTRPRPGTKVLLLTETSDPLLATGRFGLGRSAAFTSDITPRWSSEWMSWRDYGKFWGQLLRYVAGSGESRDVTTLLTRLSENRYRLQLQLPEIKPGGTNWTARLSSGTGAGSSKEMTLCGVDRVQLDFEVAGGKNFTLTASDKSGQKVTINHFTNYPAEYLLDTKVPEVIMQLPKFTEKKIIEPAKPAPAPVSLAFPMVLAGLLSLLGSVLLRRL